VMEEICSNPLSTDEISLDRCRELLGDEAVELCDDDIDRIRRCADTVARIVLELFIDKTRPTLH
jgi:hypothetical protein